MLFRSPHLPDVCMYSTQSPSMPSLDPHPFTRCPSAHPPLVLSFFYNSLIPSPLFFTRFHSSSLFSSPLTPRLPLLSSSQLLSSAPYADMHSACTVRLHALKVCRAPSKGSQQCALFHESLEAIVQRGKIATIRRTQRLLRLLWKYGGNVCMIKRQKGDKVNGKDGRNRPTSLNKTRETNQDGLVWLSLSVHLRWRVPAGRTQDCFSLSLSLWHSVPALAWQLPDLRSFPIVRLIDYFLCNYSCVILNISAFEGRRALF